MASFTVDGKSYELDTDPDVADLAAAENAYGIDMATAATFNKILAFVWIAMRHENPDLKPEDVHLRSSALAELAEEADVNPPAVRPAEPNSISGERSEHTSAGLEETLTDTGDPGSVIGLDSVRTTFFSALQAS